MSQDYTKEVCECGVINWVYLGDLSDVTQRDVEGYICRSCKNPYSFLDAIELEMGMVVDPDSFEIGLERPN